MLKVIHIKSKEKWYFAGPREANAPMTKNAKTKPERSLANHFGTRKSI